MIETDIPIPEAEWKKYLAEIRQYLKDYKENPSIHAQAKYLSLSVDYTVRWCEKHKAEDLFAACKLRADAFFALARCQAGEITTETFARIIKLIVNHEEGEHDTKTKT